MKTMSIFGSTGAIGKKTLSIAASNAFNIVAITGHSNSKLLIEQAKHYKPKYVCVTNETAYNFIKSELSNYEIEVVPASELKNIASLDVDCCVMAIAGNAGVIPTFLVLGHAKRLAIATKEAIIAGGKFLMESAQRSHTEIIPIDSEHSAIFQCIMNEKKEEIDKIILTASGGSFLDLEYNELKHVTINDALAHPNWIMGKKITIDSATMINKALEIIEAHYIFDIDISKIEAIIHPNSIIHGIVKFQDGNFKSIISFPDMSIPISFSLNYPKRNVCHIKEINFSEVGKLEFREPKDWQKRNIDLAYLAIKEKKVIALSIANEKYVYEFLQGKIKFHEIYDRIYRVLERSDPESIYTLEDINNVIASCKFRLV